MKLKMNMSNGDWRELCGMLGIPNRKKAILKCIHDNSDWAIIKPFTGQNLQGAYASCEKVFGHLCQQITKHQKWNLNGLSHVLVKVFADERDIWGKNWFTGICIASVKQPQHMSCFSALSVMKVKQKFNEELMNEVENQVHVQRFLNFLNLKPIHMLLQNGVQNITTIRTCLAVDWMQAIATLLNVLCPTLLWQ